MSQFYFFYFLNAIFGFLYYLAWFQFLKEIAILDSFYELSSILTFIFSFLVLYHSLFYQYVHRLFFVALALVSIAESALHAYFLILYLKDIDFFQYFYMLQSPQMLNEAVKVQVLYKKILVFFNLVLALGTMLWLRKNEIYRSISSIYINFILKSPNMLTNLKKIILTLILSFVFFYGFILFSLFLTQKALDFASKGFLIFETGGLFTKSKVYQKKMPIGLVSVHLYPTIHIGPKSFYENYDKSMPENSLVLEEGVTDKNRKMTYNIRDDYASFAKEFNFVVQPLIPSLSIAKKKNILYQMADVDVSSFSEKTLKLLEIYFSQINQSFVSSLGGLQTGFKINPLNLKTFREDVIVKRNQAVFDNMEKALQKTNTRSFIVPWGALHMRGIEEELVRRGYEKTAEEKHIFISMEEMESLMEKKGAQKKDDSENEERLDNEKKGK